MRILYPVHESRRLSTFGTQFAHAGRLRLQSHVPRNRRVRCRSPQARKPQKHRSQTAFILPSRLAAEAALLCVLPLVFRVGAFLAASMGVRVRSAFIAGCLAAEIARRAARDLPRARFSVPEYDRGDREHHAPDTETPCATRRVFDTAERGARRGVSEQTGADRSRVLTVWNCPSNSDLAAPRAAAPVEEMWLLYQGSIVPDRLPLVLDAMAGLPANVKVRIAGYETVGSAGYLRHFADTPRSSGSSTDWKCWGRFLSGPTCSSNRAAAMSVSR